VHVHRAGLPDEDVRREGELTMYFGGVGAALTRPDGSLEAVADPRREGVARVVGPA
jgi:gamma-glutamyltranspeptidase / glutathione hydrolase